MKRVKYDISEKTLYEVSPTAFSVGDLGIFTYLDSMDVPWKDLDLTTTLNHLYYGNHSGDKIVSPIIDKLISHNDTPVLTVAQVTALAQMIYNLNHDRWNRLWEVNKYDYDPGENYNMAENEITEFGHTSTRTDNLQHGETGDSTQTPQNTVTETNTRYGFNGGEVGQKADEIETVNGGKIENEYTNNYTDTGTQETAEGGENERNLTRHGNIGVTTTSKMLEEVINLWQWNFFRDVVFKDVDLVLTIPIY